MNDVRPISQQFEQEIRQAMAVPSIRPEFALALRRKVLLEAANLEEKPIKRPKLYPVWVGGLSMAFIVLIVLTINAFLNTWKKSISYSVRDITTVLAQPSINNMPGGISVEVNQLTVDSSKTMVVYQVAGLQTLPEPINTNNTCTEIPQLILPNGLSVPMTELVNLERSADAMLVRLVYQRLPAEVQHVKLVFACLPGLVNNPNTENISLSLNLMPKPEDYQPDLDALFSQNAVTKGTASVMDVDQVDFDVTSVVFNKDEKTLTVNGYVTWQDEKLLNADYISLDVSFSTANGKKLAYLPLGINQSAKNGQESPQINWMITLADFEFTQPIVVTLDRISVYCHDDSVNPVEIQLEKGLQPGQIQVVNQVLKIEGRDVKIIDVSLVETADNLVELVLSLHFNAPIASVTFTDASQSQPDAPCQTQSEINQTTCIAYAEKPSGTLNLQLENYLMNFFHVKRIRLLLNDTMDDQTKLPDVPTLEPTPRITPVVKQNNTACFTKENWQAVLNGGVVLPPPTMPQYLVTSPAKIFPDMVSVTDRITGMEKDLSKGVGFSTSPDGNYLAYISGTFRLAVYNLNNDVTRYFTTPNNYYARNPISTVWSPDSEWVALLPDANTRLDGSVFVIRKVGSDLQKIGTAPMEATRFTNWINLPKNQVMALLDIPENWVIDVAINGRNYGSLILGDETAQVINILSPDLKWVTSLEKIPNSDETGVYVRNTRTGEKQLLYKNSLAVNELKLWTPDSAWFAFANVLYNGSTRETIYPLIINPETCEVRYFHDYNGTVNGWLGDLSAASTFIDTSTCAADYTRLKVGMQATVIGSEDATFNNVRSTPTVRNNIIATLPIGSTVKILDGPICADGFVFWKISSDEFTNGMEGWTAEGDGVAYYLAPLE